MKMKKIMSMLLVTAMTLTALTGCGGNQPAATGTEDAEQTAAPAEGTTEAAPGADAGDKIKISFINGFTGGDGAFMRKITDGFNASQDQYFIEELQEKDHYVKFETGDFDLVVIHGDLLATYVQNEAIREIGDVYDQAGISVGDFHAAGEKIVNINDGLYAFPLDIHPLTMFYNKKLVPEAPATYEELKKLTGTMGDYVYPMAVPGAGLVEWYMMFLAAQNGVTVDDGTAMKYNTDEFADTILMLNEMIFNDKISPQNLGLDGEFNAFMNSEPNEASAQAAVALTGPWFYGAALEKYGDDLGVAPVPQFGKNAGTYGNAHTIAVSSKVEDSAKLEGISAFMTYLFTAENLLNWADSGQAPLYKPVMEYIEQNKDQYPLPYANQQQFDGVLIAPQVYLVREQTRYLNENVYALLMSQEGLTKEELMPELEKATQFALEIAEQ